MDAVLAKVELPRRRFTMEEYYRLAEVGILRPRERVELIEGEIVQMSPIGLRHAASVVALTRRLILAAGDRARLSPQNPVRLLGDTEPEPDIALIRPRADRYVRAPIGPRDVLLLVEVADTSYRYDRYVKLPLYARTRVREVWIVDLLHDVIEIHRRPSRDRYTSFAQVGPGGTVSPAAFPDIVLPVDDELLAH